MGDQSDEVVEGVQNPTKTTLRAVLLLVLGTLIAAVFADPLVDAVDNFSTATSIPTFFISFIALPLATNSSEAVSAIIFASRKKIRTASLTFSEVHLTPHSFVWSVHFMSVPNLLPMLRYAALWGSDHEQCPLPLSLPGPRLLQRTDVGFLGGSTGYSRGLRGHGLSRELPHVFPPLDINHSLCTLPVLTGAGVRPRLRARLVIEPSSKVHTGLSEGIVCAGFRVTYRCYFERFVRGREGTFSFLTLGDLASVSFWSIVVSWTLTISLAMTSLSTLFEYLTTIYMGKALSSLCGSRRS